MAAFTVRLPDEQSAQLDQLAGKLDRSRSYLAARAIEDYLARESWQITEIEAGLAEADKGEFASDSDVAAVLNTYIRSM
jgi:predicted transcriptional regulator